VAQGGHILPENREPNQTEILVFWFFRSASVSMLQNFGPRVRLRFPRPTNQNTDTTEVSSRDPLPPRLPPSRVAHIPVVQPRAAAQSTSRTTPFTHRPTVTQALNHPNPKPYLRNSCSCSGGASRWRPRDGKSRGMCGGDKQGAQVRSGEEGAACAVAAAAARTGNSARPAAASGSGARRWQHQAWSGGAKQGAAAARQGAAPGSSSLNQRG
jgi:hypothetical protein